MRAGRESASRARCVVLVGMMGSGKTTVGRLLARRTGWPYRDNDELVDSLFNTTPRRILDERGEPELRRAESEALRLGLEVEPPGIVGAAAGTILEADNRQRLGDAGVVVWLRASSATLLRRAVGAEHRPWLDHGPEAWIGAAVTERDPLYEAVADIVVDTDGRSPADVVAEIVERLELAVPGAD